jgi:hypothetical protein
MATGTDASGRRQDAEIARARKYLTAGQEGQGCTAPQRLKTSGGQG